MKESKAQKDIDYRIKELKANYGEESIPLHIQIFISEVKKLKVQHQKLQTVNLNLNTIIVKLEKEAENSSRLSGIICEKETDIKILKTKLERANKILKDLQNKLKEVKQ